MRALAGVVAILLIAALAYLGWREWTPATGPAGGDAASPAVAGSRGTVREETERASRPAPAATEPAPESAADTGEEDPDEPSREPAMETDARRFLADLRPPAGDAIPAGKADHFVAPSQRLRLAPERPVETATLRELTLDLPPNAPVTVVREARQIELAWPEKLIADAGGDLERKVEVLLGEEVMVLPLGEVLAKHDRPDAPISVVKLVEYFEPTTPAQLARGAREDGGGWDHLIRIIKQPYRIGTVTVADLLAGIKRLGPDTLLYVHSVTEEDVQGVWGIVHTGLIDKFARGLAIRRGEALATYRVQIPQDADEREADASSSFLGRLIDVKTRESAVYNYRIGRMNRNPDLVVPGAEIVIVDFAPGELISIYEHFLELQSRTAHR